MKRMAIMLLVCGAVVLTVLSRRYWAMAGTAVSQKVQGKKSVADRVDEFGTAVAGRLTPHFKAAGISYPPVAVVLLGFKKERRLEVYAAGKNGKYVFVRTYPIQAASGGPGPKLSEGDGQVPEGLYRVSFLNPNSLFHLSLRVNYPNEFDRTRAKDDGRTKLGGDIMIHGSRFSVGCLAMGDEAAEDLFVLAALTGTENVRVVLSPVDFRKTPRQTMPAAAPAWTSELYGMIREELMKYAS